MIEVPFLEHRHVQADMEGADALIFFYRIEKHCQLRTVHISHFNLFTQEEIACVKGKEAEMRAQGERCSHAAEHFWSLLAKQMDGYKFRDAAEEIRFYKQIKPLFISEIKFYRQLYHLILFEPSEKPDQIKDFQLREMQRFDKFVRDNQEFCDYYKSGRTDRDE